MEPCPVCGEPLEDENRATCDLCGRPWTHELVWAVGFLCALCEAAGGPHPEP